VSLTTKTRRTVSSKDKARSFSSPLFSLIDTSSIIILLVNLLNLTLFLRNKLNTYSGDTLYRFAGVALEFEKGETLITSNHLRLSLFILNLGYPESQLECR
jgi:hypothetical protein